MGETWQAAAASLVSFACGYQAPQVWPLVILLGLVILVLVGALCFCCGRGAALAVQLLLSTGAFRHPAARSVAATLARPALKRLAGYLHEQ